MTGNTFVRLAIAAVLTSVGALLAYAWNNDWTQGRVAGEKLLPSLASGSADVAGIAITEAGKTVTLSGKGKDWTLKERDGFPVAPEKVRELLVRLSNAELIEAKTRKEDRYKLLELEDPKSKDAKSRSVTLLNAGGTSIAELVIGKRRFDAFGSGKSGTYVRKAGDPQTWLTSADVDPRAEVKSWIETSVFQTDADKVKALAIAIPGEEPLRLKRGDGDKAKLAFEAFPPEGKKLRDASAADTIARAAASFEAEDVRKLAQTPVGDGVSTVDLTTGDGVAMTLRLRKEKDDWWLSLDARGEGDAKAKAEALAKKTMGWEFKVPGYKVDNLLKKRKELLEEEKKKDS